jgi:putative toxin-antitoxin system antitoxin component (TIGR02293 family)
MTNQLHSFEELLAEVTAEAVELFEGDSQAANDWLHRPLRAIGYEIPYDFMDSPKKIGIVRDIIGRLEHGVFT